MPAEKRRSRPGFHRHPHGHGAEPAHAHPHHHARAAAAAHEHAHAGGFESLTYVISPVHSLDPRAKVIAALALVTAVVLSPPLRPLEFAGVAASLLATCAAARLPVGRVLARTALVLPFAGVIALFAPLQAGGGSLSVGGIAGAYSGGGWIAAYAILSKAWLSAFSVIVLSATTPVPKLFHALERLRVPRILVTMLSFLYRYSAVLGGQVLAMRRAIESRAPRLSARRRVALYGNLAGSMVVRAYERGERVHAAMLSRGYDGSLPSADTAHAGPADVLMLVAVGCVAGALLLY